MEALQQLEHIDDEAVLFGISFVRTSDREASSAFGLVDSLPSLVYFRHKIPVVFGGQLDDEEEVFEFLYQSRFVKPGYCLAGICTIIPSRLFRYVPEDTRNEPAAEIDAVSSVQLEILLGHVDQILVLFSCDDTPDGLKSELALRALGAAKEHFESRGISVVRTNAVKQACLHEQSLNILAQNKENIIRVWISSSAHFIAS